MTELEIRQSVIETAMEWKGTVDGDARHHEMVNIYNAHSPLARGFKMSVNQAWCSMFVSVVSIQNKMTHIIPTEIGVGKHVDLFKKLHIWVEADDYVPKIADIIVYDWNDDGNGENTDGASHIGYVSDVTSTSIEVIEGNKGVPGKVDTRWIKINGQFIRGFATPDYASMVTYEPEVDHKIVVGDRVKIRKGATWYNGKRIPSSVMKKTHVVDELVGNRAVLDRATICSPIDVGNLSKVTNNKDEIKVDGEWGRSTTLAIQKKLKVKYRDGMLSGQYSGNLGYCISKDAVHTSGWEFVDYISTIGSPTVKAFQSMVGLPYRDQDGVFGPSTVRATQMKFNVRLTGKLDKRTVKTIQKWCNE